MARYQIILAYDGTDFSGSQRQAKPRTVQGELENALRKMGWTGSSVLMAGRTDVGVHASGQVASFDLDWRHSSSDLNNALNATLPADMAVRAVQVAPADFHPRFNATSRRYRYRIFCQSNRDPLRERYAWRVRLPLDNAVLQDLAKVWLGEHDFAAFGSPPRPGGSTQRMLMQASWQQNEDEWLFEVQANAFLYHMVRRIVHVQVAVAQGKVPAEVVAQALAEQVEVPSGLAPSNGLTLVEVTYPDNLKFKKEI